MVIYDPHMERTRLMGSMYSVDVAETGKEAVADSDLVVFAVKPQNIDKVA